MDNSAVWMGGAGAVAAVIAVLAWLADRVRSRRSRLDAVGFMPWTAVSFWSTLLALLLLGAAAKSWL